MHVAETYHKGPLGSEYSALHLDTDALSLLCFKHAEAEDGYILRLNEMTGAPCTARLSLPLLGREETLSFTPFEIKTLFIPADAHLPIEERLLTEYGGNP